MLSDNILTFFNKVRIPLNSIDHSTILTVKLEVGDYSNSWRIFVFVPKEAEAEVRFIRTREELDAVIHNGGKAIVTAECWDNKNKGSFIPVFWSPVHFPTQKPCGAMINEKHPIFEDFRQRNIRIISGKDYWSIPIAWISLILEMSWTQFWRTCPIIMITRRLHRCLKQKLEMLSFYSVALIWMRIILNADSYVEV